MVEENSMYNGYHVNTMANNLILYWADEIVIFCGINFLGGCHDSSCALTSYQSFGNKLVSIKFVFAKVFHDVDMLSTCWLGHGARSLQAHCHLSYIGSFLDFPIHIFLSSRPVSGVCIVFGALFGGLKAVCLVWKEEEKDDRGNIYVHNFTTHYVSCNKITVFDSE